MKSQNFFQYGNVCAAQGEKSKLPFGRTGQLRIRCLDSETKQSVAPDFVAEQPSGTSYSVEKFPNVDGYEHAVDVVSGTMPDSGYCTRFVYYTPIADTGYRPHRLRNAIVISIATVFTIASCVLPSPLERLYEHFFAEHTEPAPIVEVNDGPSVDEVVESIIDSTDQMEHDSALSQITIKFDFDDGTVMSPAIMLGQAGNPYYYEVPQKDGYITSHNIISGTFDGTDHTYKVRYYSTTPKLPPEHPATSGQDSTRDPSNQGDATKGAGPNDPTGYGLKDPAKDPLSDIPGAHAPSGETNGGNAGNSSDDRITGSGQANLPIIPGSNDMEAPGAEEPPITYPTTTTTTGRR